MQLLNSPSESKALADAGESRITEEASFINADILVSACPLCKESFSKDADEKGIELKDIAEIISDLL